MGDSMKYHALYRKYRPKNFDEVVGQSVTIKILKNAIINDRISHAYLFYGPRGTGKTSIAKIFARTINCENNDKGIPCEKCDSCINSINAGCPDIIEIDAASNNGVDEIRELKSKISFTPSELKYKVYIIDEVHMLSTGAFNALLKTLEDPPEHAIFILATTELQKVPLTIISRCQTLEFKKIDDNSMKNKLAEISKKEHINIDDSGINEIILSSNGGLRDAIGLLEKAFSYENKIDENIIREISGNISLKELLSIIDLIDNKEIEELLKIINKYYNDGYDLIKIGNSIINILRNKMIEKMEFNSYYSKVIIELDTTIGKMKKSDNPKILFEIALINCTQDNLKTDTNAIEQKDEQKIKTENNNLKENKINDFESKLDNDEIKFIRVSNTLCDPKKSIILNIRNDWSKIKNLAFDEKYGNLARILSTDVMPVASSETNIILVSKLNGIASQINNDIDMVDEIINKTFNYNYKSICLSQNEWQNYTNEYKNNKDKFIYKEEPKIINKDKTLHDKVKELFDE